MKEIKHTVTVKLKIDPEEYPMPADGNTRQQLSEEIENALYDLDGIEVVNVKVS